MNSRALLGGAVILFSVALTMAPGRKGAVVNAE
jgi:hypothetical protein